jgi:hypothetical protein
MYNQDPAKAIDLATCILWMLPRRLEEHILEFPQDLH